MILIVILSLEFIFLHFCMVSGNQFQPDSICIIMISVFSLVYILKISKSEKYAFYMRELVSGYLLRVFLLFFDIYGKNIYTLPNSGPDANSFFKSAQWYAGFSTQGTDMGSYAYVMGLTNVWAKKFEQIKINRPEWFTSYDVTTFAVIDAMRMNHLMDTMYRSAATTIVTSSDKGGGGWGSFGGGGGFSGGGSGGGGGGAW